MKLHFGLFIALFALISCGESDPIEYDMPTSVVGRWTSIDQCESVTSLTLEPDGSGSMFTPNACWGQSIGGTYVFEDNIITITLTPGLFFCGEDLPETIELKVEEGSRFNYLLLTQLTDSGIGCDQMQFRLR